MNSIPRLIPSPCALLTVTLAFAFSTGLVHASDDSFFGRWALTLPDGRAGWLEIRDEGGWYDGDLLWGGGSVVPLAYVVIDDGTLTAIRIRNIDRRDADGNVVRTQQIAETIIGRTDGENIALAHIAPRPDGAGFERAGVSGRRIPPLPPPPDLDQVNFGPPVVLFNGTDLSGWRLINPDHENGWKVENGILINRPAPRVEGQPRRRFGNIRTDQEFEDFNLTLEVNVPEGSNSGVYLRGIYEVQILDSYGKPPEWHNMGAIYSRIVPSVAAEKPPGEWQTLDMTLVDRHVTVILNGVTIIDNQPLAGCTGGALWSDEFRPGPIFLQGDHGPVDFRNIVLRPVVR